MPKTIDQTSTRARLLRGAVVVGARTGWGGITTRTVAAEAGVIPGVVHYHLGSVSALRLEAVRTALADLAAQTEELLGAADDPAAAVEALVRSVTSTPPSDAVTLVHEAYLASAREPEVRELLVEQVVAFRAWVAEWLDAATTGQPDREDPVRLAAALVAALDGLYLHHVLDPAFDAAAAVRPLVRALTGGRSGAEPPGAPTGPTP